MNRLIPAILLTVFCFARGLSQLPIARDTLSVMENGYVLKMPWANGINFANASNIDLNGDNKKDLVFFDRINQLGTGRFRCFINTGGPGQVSFVPDLQLSYHFPVVSNWAVLIDFNCDGKEDLFCSTSAGIRVYKNTSNGTYLNFTLFKSLLYTDYGGTNGKTNLYASSVGVPGIVDVDGDGDLDVLTFSPQGVFIEYHQNQSKELYNNCDSLVFLAKELCWGRVSESQDIITMNICAFKGPHGELKELHAGSCLTCVDTDGDKDQDLLMGDIAGDKILYAHNGGTSANALITDTTSQYPNYPLIGNTLPVRINSFPCAYYVTVDGDQNKDLVATPNAFGGENFRSVWYYRNTSSTSTVNFQFVKKNLMQDEMIEVGQNAFPVQIDYDNDGKKDLLIGNFGYYSNNSLNARLALYRNISSTAVPAYSLITRDFGNLGAQNLFNAIPTAGDIDADGDVDICLGTASGQVHWLENTGGAGPGNFSVFHSNPFTFTTTSAVAAPQLFDFDGDNLLDLLIGMKNGRIAYYRNVGTGASPSFSLMTNNLGNVNVQGDPYLYGLDGYAVPYFYRDNGSVYCMVGSVSGTIWQYQVSGAYTSPFNLLTSSVNGINEGSQSAVVYADFDNDGKRDLMIGNGSGGLTYFSSSSPKVGLSEHAVKSLRIYPNPVSAILNISFDQAIPVASHAEIFDVSGRRLLSGEFSTDDPYIDVTALQSGFYILRLTLGDQSQLTNTFIKD